MVVISELLVKEDTVSFSEVNMSDSQMTSENRRSSKDGSDNDNDCDGSVVGNNEEDGDDSDEVTGDESDDPDEEADDMLDSEGTSDYDDNSEEADETDRIRPSGIDIVKEVLEKAAREAENNPSIAVTKHLDLEYDLGTLLAVDTNELDFDLLRDSTEEYLQNLARDNTQLLINRIWELPITRKENEIVAKLPSATYKLPRDKPVPKPLQKTKWQQFAEEKGIQKKKKKVEWNESLQKWVPTWGYKRVQAQRQEDWLIETKKNDNPMEDPYAKKRVEKQERVAKNELQRLRNLAQAKNVKIPRREKIYGDKKERKGEPGQQNKNKASKRKGEPVPRMGFLTPDKMNTIQLKQAITISKSSTASLGKFQRRLPKERDARNINSIMPMAKKRRAPFLTPEQEKKANLGVIDGILKKRPKLDLEKAVNRHINQEERERAEEKSQKPKGKGRGKGKGKAKAKSGGKVNSQGKGQGKARMGNKGNKGRKEGGKRKGGGKKR